jgi:hypothetical protein
MQDVIEIGNVKFQVPEGYRHVKWDRVNDDDVVYLIGKRDNKPFAYGPFTVHNKEYRELKNNSARFIGGRVFKEYPESLLIKE